MVSVIVFELNKSMRYHEILDESIFTAKKKVIFMAGSPGAGKTTVLRYIIGNYGFKFIDTDGILERKMEQAGLSIKMTQDTQDQVNSIRNNIFAFADRVQKLYIDNGTSMVIDTTSSNLEWVRSCKETFEANGYQALMVYVDVSLEQAQTRNAKRLRSLPDEIVQSMHTKVSGNKNGLRMIFGSHFVEIDNSTDGIESNDPRITAIYKRIMAWAKP